MCLICNDKIKTKEDTKDHSNKNYKTRRAIICGKNKVLQRESIEKGMNITFEYSALHSPHFNVW